MNNFRRKIDIDKNFLLCEEKKEIVKNIGNKNLNEMFAHFRISETVSHCQVVLCEEDLCIGLNTQVDFLIETQTGTVSLKKRVKRVI